MSIYLILKFLHVLRATVAIGFNASYPIWLNRATQEPEHALWAPRGVKRLDDRFANPRGTLVGLLLSVDVVVIVFLMVTKPTL